MLSAAAVVWGASALVVESRVACPATAAVSDRLSRLAVEAPAGSGLTGRIEARGRGIAISLRDAAGDAVAERSIEAPHDCDTLADAAAVLLAAWVGAAPPAYRLSVPPAPAVDASARAPSRARGAVFGVAVAGGPAFDDRSAAFMALASVGWRPDGVVWGGRVSAAATSERRTSLGEADVSWTRGWASLGPTHAWSVRSFAVEAHAGGALALLRARGRGFAEDETRLAVTPGGVAGLRVGWRSGRLTSFVELGSAFWPRRIAAATEMGTVFALPRLEMWAALGLAFGRS